MTSEATSSRSNRPWVPGLLLTGLGGIAVVVALLAVMDRWPVPASAWVTAARAGALTTLIVVPVLRPTWGIYLVFFALPFFGNRPGGRYMELINVIVGASIIGLSIHALRHRFPFPRHLTLVLAWTCVISACVALVPAMPGILHRWGPVGDLTTATIETFSSVENDPFYSVAKLCLLLFAVGWATVLVWAHVERHLVNAFRTMVVALLLTTALGILDFHGLIDLDTYYLLYLDPRALDDPPFRSMYSIFWNPGWFAWYFSMSFGVALGLSLLSSGRRRYGLLAGLALAYAYFLTNRQRGGFIAVHVAILVVAAYWLWHTKVRRRTLLLQMGAVPALALVLVAVGAAWPTMPEPTGLRRLLEHPSDLVRSRLALAAIQMWQGAPLFGIGESAFAWRYREFVPVGSPLEVITYGDAHNTWLQVLATRGLFGFLAYVGVWIAVVKILIRELRSPRSLALPAAAGLSAFFVYSFVQGMFYLQAIQLLFWGLIALLVAMAPRPQGASRRRLAPILTVSTACALILAFWVNGARIADAWGAFQVEPRGFYPVESPAPDRVGRWSSRRGTLCLYPTRDVTVVDLQALNPDIDRRPVTVTLAHGGTILDRVRLTSAGRVQRRVNLPRAVNAARRDPTEFGECRAGAVRLSVAVDHVWRPAAFGLSGDQRHLGVFVSTPSPPSPE